MLKRLVVFLVLGSAVVWTAVALATPSHGAASVIVAQGTLQADVAYNTGLAVGTTGITWDGKQYAANQLPEFMMHLRSGGVTDIGAWLNLHPAVSAKFGMVAMGLLHNPEIVTQQTTFAPGSASGWHSHPGYLAVTVMSGQVVRYAADCSSQTFTAGQSFNETGANTYIVKNIGTVPAAVNVEFFIPGGTPLTGLRVDQPQPTTCTQ